jgi:murein DD-endopeptidase MepM/ murein hydrolase activator NlpD
VPSRNPSSLSTRPGQVSRASAARAGSSRTALAVALALCAVALAPASAGAATGSISAGGYAYVETPTIAKLACVRGCASHRRLQGGSTVRISGRSLSGVVEVTFHGGASATDDVKAAARPRGSKSVELRVPATATAGPLSLRTASAVSPPTAPIDILPPLPPEILTSQSHVFPVRGAHDYGGAGALFGTGRAGHSHQGHDVFAACGVPLVAARGGTVQVRGYHAAAGNYLVIDGEGTETDYAYMHLEQRSPFRKGDAVATGQRIGSVGDSGNARGCHLHLELWSGPGWYEGGRPIDPLRALKAWDSWS